MTLSEQVQTLAVDLQNKYPYRKGQALVNALRTTNNELYKELTAIEFNENDCFYVDAKIPNFLKWLGTKD